jgi:hypothetical protein
MSNNPAIQYARQQATFWVCGNNRRAAMGNSVRVTAWIALLCWGIIGLYLTVDLLVTGATNRPLL